MLSAYPYIQVISRSQALLIYECESSQAFLIDVILLKIIISHAILNNLAIKIYLIANSLGSQFLQTLKPLLENHFKSLNFF